MFVVVRKFGKPKSAVFEGLGRFSCLIFIDCGVVMAIQVHQCESFTICAERIQINLDRNERVMLD